MPIINKMHPLFPILLRSKNTVLTHAFELHRQLEATNQHELSQKLKAHTRDYYYTPEKNKALIECARLTHSSLRSTPFSFLQNRETLKHSTQLLKSLNNDHHLMSENAAIDQTERMMEHWGPFILSATLLGIIDLGAMERFSSVVITYAIAQHTAKNHFIPKISHEQYDYIDAADMNDVTSPEEITAWLGIKSESKDTIKTHLSEHEPSFRI